VADAVEALGQHVQQETPDELVDEAASSSSGRGRRDIVFPAERNRVVGGGNETAVRDGDPMGVT
jgi:hypothetical protein